MEFKFKVGGKEFAVADEAGAKLFQEALDQYLEGLEKAKAEAEKVKVETAKSQERLAALEAEAKVYKSKCEEFEKRVRALESGEALQALVTERLELVRKAEEKVPNFVAGTKTNRQIMVEVIRTIDPEFKDEGRTDSEVRAIYEAVIRAEAALATQAAKAVAVQPVAQKDDLAKRLAEARERSRGRSSRLLKETVNK